MFERIDTFIVRVQDLAVSLTWYERVLGLAPVYEDSEERLAVLSVGEHHSLTLWELNAGEVLPPAGAAVAYPIFAVPDAAQAHAHISSRGGSAGPLHEGAGVRYFHFNDPDGNRLEVCQVLAPTPV